MKRIIGWILISLSFIPLVIGLIALYATIETSVQYKGIDMSNEASGFMNMFGIAALVSGFVFIILLQIGLVLKKKKE